MNANLLIKSISTTNTLSALEEIDFSKYYDMQFTKSPEDWRDIPIYQIMIDRFNNPDNPPKHKWDGLIEEFQGGTFKGIEEKIDYIKDLGIKAVWLTPIQQNCLYNDKTHHGYGIQDFLKVDKRFASNQDDPEGELKQLINKLHENGIYVIFDIVINHTGDIFEYDGIGAEAQWSNHKLPIKWRNDQGKGTWQSAPLRNQVGAAGAVGPIELLRDEYFRAQGKYSKEQEKEGDFYTLKELKTEHTTPETFGDVYPVRNILIESYKYIMAEFDIDGYRIDTLKYVKRGFSKIFGNAMREFALRLGKKNFLTYGEVWDNEETMARFIGRSTSEDHNIIGVDSTLDFPLQANLKQISKGFKAPSELAKMYSDRKKVLSEIVSSHGEASRYYVTFLDNHDMNERIYHPYYDRQLTLALACQFSLQGLPCVYYGTEQGLGGSKNYEGNAKPECVREAMWGKDNAFDTNNDIYKSLKTIIETRNSIPALRYGRQYFREISGDGENFGLSTYNKGVIAFSRILGDQEALIVANCDPENNNELYVLVDPSINNENSSFSELYSNFNDQSSNEKYNAVEKLGVKVNNSKTNIVAIKVSLQPNEVKILIN